MDDVEHELQEAAGEVLTTVRLGKQLSSAMETRLKLSLHQCARHWAGSEVVPKSAANLFIDLANGIDACSYAYKGEDAKRIKFFADEIADLVRACVE